jgi:hypothetical protein
MFCVTDAFQQVIQVMEQLTCPKMKMMISCAKCYRHFRHLTSNKKNNTSSAHSKSRLLNRLLILPAAILINNFSGQLEIN